MSEVKAAGVSKGSIKTKEISLVGYGTPSESLRMIEFEISDEPSSHEVLIKMLAAPINPSDFMAISGIYPIPDMKFPQCMGFEGVYEVVKVGSGVQSVKPNDRVMTKLKFIGSWRTYAMVKEQDVCVVPKDIPVLHAAVILINPGTALRLLSDFVKLEQGDWIIQNASNSHVGQCIIRLCKTMGIKTINLVRDRPEIAKLKEHLTSLGADVVLTEEEVSSMKTEDFKNFLGVNILELTSLPKLALDAVGGASVHNLLKFLVDSGTMVTYGGMSGELVGIPPISPIFHDHKFLGFWLTRWMVLHKSDGLDEKFLLDLYSRVYDQTFILPECQTFPLESYQEAFTVLSQLKSSLSAVRPKIILTNL